MGLTARILLGILTLLMFDLALAEPDATSRPVRAEALEQPASYWTQISCSSL